MFPASAGIPPRGLARLRDGLSVGWQAVSDRVTAAAGACSGKVNQCDRFCARASGQSRWESAVPGSAILTIVLCYVVTILLYKPAWKKGS